MKTKTLLTMVLLLLIVLPTRGAARDRGSSGEPRHSTSGYPRNAFLDLEDGEIVSVFNRAGMTWKSCPRTEGCQAIGWPDNQSKIRVLGPKVRAVAVDPFTGKLGWEEYYPIEFSYNRGMANGATLRQQGRGWIDAGPVRFHRQTPIFRTPKQGRIENDPKALANLTILAVAESLKASVGICAYTKTDELFKLSEKANVYDSLVLAKVRKTPLPAIPREDGRPMTRQDLLEIDALARTLYGEMASCYKHGLQYPLAVARIAVNRAHATERAREFIKGPHAAEKTPLVRVLTTPSQFNVWMPFHSGQPNGSLRLALCPPQQSDQRYWRGLNPPPFEIETWRNSVRIAVEAVLYPKKFEERTKSVRQYHYTSAVGRFYGMRQVYPIIEGRRVARNSCVEVWSERAE